MCFPHPKLEKGLNCKSQDQKKIPQTLKSLDLNWRSTQNISQGIIWNAINCMLQDVKWKQLLYNAPNLSEI